MPRRLVWACCMAATAAIPLWAQQRVFQSVKATPDRIQTGEATVTVEAALAQNVAASRMTVRLERVQADGSAQNLGVFRNEGGRLTLAVTFREAAPGRIQLRAAAVPASPAMVAMPRPVYSEPVFISVTQAAPEPAQPAQVFRSLRAAPDRIQTGEATVTVEAALVAGIAPGRVTVRLERLVPNARQPEALGNFRDAGGGRFTIAVTFREPTPGRIQLRAAAVPSAPAAVAAPRPSYSDPVFITVSQAPPARPPVTQQARGFRAAIPDGFVWNTKVAEAGGPWSVNNFRSQYLRGGVVPTGGCEIEGTSGPARLGAAEQLRKDMPGVTVREATANGHPALRVQQDEEVAPGLTYRTLSAYISAGQSTYKLFATFRAGDGAEAACRAAFDRVLGSFTPTGGR
ncbi:MAG: hypothetical protein KIT09_23640 [Bryobacteraceae bacterium]|nr:hypothetical protein [Bryobacteraceae bacterium]